MQSQTMNTENVSGKTIFIKMVLDAWETHQGRFNKLLDSLTEEQLMSATAPGRNRGIYLAGHLIAVNDGMLPLLGFGEKIQPGLETVFIRNADDPTAEYPTMESLKQYRDEVNARLAAGMAAMQPDDWFTKHSSVSAEDFAREPHRNKLNILINRTNHLSYHLGQLAYLVR